MTVTIDLRPEIEASLAAIAARNGVTLPEYISRLVEQQVPTPSQLSPAERAAAWRNSVKDIPYSPPLSDEAISRESIYAGRG
jgi:hypothetical protein